MAPRVNVGDKFSSLEELLSEMRREFSEQNHTQLWMGYLDDKCSNENNTEARCSNEAVGGSF